jgi:hypothetical protein
MADSCRKSHSRRRSHKIIGYGIALNRALKEGKEEQEQQQQIKVEIVLPFLSTPFGRTFYVTIRSITTTGCGDYCHSPAKRMAPIHPVYPQAKVARECGLAEGPMSVIAC